MLFISDEVQTGWGRTGETFWGFQSHNVTPDLITFAKGLGNGVALAGVIGSPEIMDSLPGSSISTFGGSPLSCVAGLANLRYLLENDLQGNALTVGNALMNSLREKVGGVGPVADIRGKGLMIGIEFIDREGNPSSGIAASVQEAAKARGLLVGKGGISANVIRIAPPLTITLEEALAGAEILQDAVSSVLST